MSSYYHNPLTEHMVTHNHDLRDGCQNEPSGGETAKEHKQNKPKKDPIDEAFRPSHTFGTKGKVGLDLGEATTQEGLRKSGKASAGIGGLEGRPSKMGG
ncbi:hypothetical protein N0V88_007494 [Collariella sp. IMI 366227]|nr:hypothetical protein N0V88_007494 [Collariella sp. IMI 366227]